MTPLEARQNLLKRLRKVSQNNSAYIEHFGPRHKWGAKYKEVREIEDMYNLKRKVIALEAAWERVNKGK